VRIKLFSGLAIIAWQALAILFGIAGQVDTIVAGLPDPNWYVALVAGLLRPAAWLTSVSLAAAAFLLVWAWLEFRQKRKAGS
jgi:hypothetical protein